VARNARTGDVVTSLPKRGDRVRVTWAHQHSSLKVGSEVVLSSRGYSVDPANELYRPTPPPDCVAFMYADADHRERGSHAVKVEILERAKTLSEAVAEFQAACPNAFSDFEADEPEEAVHHEFARGMRRAVEIAEGLGVSEGHPGRPLALVPIRKLKEAVEKELKS
jgi:hypothetical protein